MPKPQRPKQPKTRSVPRPRDFDHLKPLVISETELREMIGAEIDRRISFNKADELPGGVKLDTICPACGNGARLTPCPTCNPKTDRTKALDEPQTGAASLSNLPPEQMTAHNGTAGMEPDEPDTPEVAAIRAKLEAMQSPKPMSPAEADKVFAANGIPPAPAKPEPAEYVPFAERDPKAANELKQALRGNAPPESEPPVRYTDVAPKMTDRDLGPAEQPPPLSYDRTTHWRTMPDKIAQTQGWLSSLVSAILWGIGLFLGFAFAAYGVWNLPAWIDNIRAALGVD